MLVSEQSEVYRERLGCRLFFFKFLFLLWLVAQCGVMSHRVILGDLALFNPFRINTSVGSCNC